MPVTPTLLVAPFDKQAAKARQAAWAKYLDVDTVKTNSIGMKMTLIPPGEFMMGCGKSVAELSQLSVYKKGAFLNEYPQHRIKITKPFQMGVYEVTLGQFRQFMNATHYKIECMRREGEYVTLGGRGWGKTTKKFEGPDIKYDYKNTGFSQSDEHPVVNITWNDAVAFCKWLSKQEGEKYRLPTEAEWEYACRSGTTGLYQTGDVSNGLESVSNTADQSAKNKFAQYDSLKFFSVRDDYVFSAPVGRYLSNAFGLYDMHGNVCEWCQDFYEYEYYGKSPKNDPSGPSSGDYRVLRGGSWYSGTSKDVRSAFRDYEFPSKCDINIGFRVVCESY